MLHACEMKARLEGLSDLSDVAVALQLCSGLLALIEHNRQLAALQDMSRWIEVGSVVGQSGWLMPALAALCWDDNCAMSCR